MWSARSNRWEGRRVSASGLGFGVSCGHMADMDWRQHVWRQGARAPACLAPGRQGASMSGASRKDTIASDVCALLVEKRQHTSRELSQFVEWSIVSATGAGMVGSRSDMTWVRRDVVLDP